MCHFKNNDGDDVVCFGEAEIVDEEIGVGDEGEKIEGLRRLVFKFQILMFTFFNFIPT